MIKHGKKSCRTCFGAGFFTETNLDRSVRTPKTCGCAITRFIKVNAKNLTLHKETGDWFWTS